MGVRHDHTLHRSAPPTVLKFAGPHLGPRQVRAIVSIGEVDRMDDIIVQTGIDLKAFRSSPTVLFNRDADKPIAKALNIGLEAGKLAALVQFSD